MEVSGQRHVSTAFPVTDWRDIRSIPLEFVCRYRNIAGPCCLLLHGRYVCCYIGAKISLASSFFKLVHFHWTVIEMEAADASETSAPIIQCVWCRVLAERSSNRYRSENLMWLKLTRDNAAVLVHEKISTQAFVLRRTVPKDWPLTKIWTQTNLARFFAEKMKQLVMLFEFSLVIFFSASYSRAYTAEDFVMEVWWKLTKFVVTSNGVFEGHFVAKKQGGGKGKWVGKWHK